MLLYFLSWLLMVASTIGAVYQICVAIDPVVIFRMMLYKRYDLFNIFLARQTVTDFSYFLSVLWVNALSSCLQTVLRQGGEPGLLELLQRTLVGTMFVLIVANIAIRLRIKLYSP